MVLFKINRLYDEIQRVYNEHYKDCKHQEVHDFYRAVMRRMRTTYQNDYVIVPVVQCRECTHWIAKNRKEKPKDEKKLTTTSPPRTCCVSWRKRPLSWPRRP